MKINFQNFGCNWFLKNKINKILSFTLVASSIKFQNFSVNISLLSENKIQALNTKFRKQEKSTDVLSFPNFELKKGQNLNFQKLIKESKQNNGYIFLGDIAICKNIAKKQAKLYGHSLKTEICFLTLHAFLHLLGYDHYESNEEIEMNFLTKKILKHFEK